MNVLRWLLVGFLILLAFAARERLKNIRAPQIIRPDYRQTSLENRDFVYYTVQAGDSLAIIERKFRIASRESILKLNPGLDPDRLPINEPIKIPLL